MAPQDAQLVVAQVEDFQAAEAIKETRRKFFQGVLAQIELLQRSQKPHRMHMVHTTQQWRGGKVKDLDHPGPGTSSGQTLAQFSSHDLYGQGGQQINVTK